MKNTIQIHKLLCAFAALLLPILNFVSFARAEDPAPPAFEGTVVMRMESPELALAGALFETKITGMFITFQMKGQKFRMEVLPELPEDANPEKATAAKAMFNIIAFRDNEKKETTVLMPAMGMRVTQPDETAAPSGSKSADTYAPTGRKDTLLGYEVEEYATANEDARTYTEMWLAKGLGAFRMASNNQGQKGQQQKSWEKFLAENDLFPLKLTEWKKKGDAKTTFALEATKVEKGELDDAIFVIPAGDSLDLSKLQKAAKALENTAPAEKSVADTEDETDEAPVATPTPRKAPRKAATPKIPRAIVVDDNDEPVQRKTPQNSREKVRQLRGLLDALDQLGN